MIRLHLERGEGARGGGGDNPRAARQLDGDWAEELGGARQPAIAAAEGAALAALAALVGAAREGAAIVRDEHRAHVARRNRAHVRQRGVEQPA